MIGPEVFRNRETDKSQILPEDLPEGEEDIKF